MKVPYPVSPEYRIRATVRPLARSIRPDGEPERGLFDPGATYLKYVDAKLAALRGDTPCRQVAGSLSSSHGRALHLLCASIQNELPQRLRVSEDRVELPAIGLTLQANFERPSARVEQATSTTGERVAAHLGALPEEACLLDAIALAIEEDYVLFQGPSGEDEDCAKLLHVCLPSGWSARDKVGLNFGAIHIPVPHNSPLMAAHHGLVRTLVHRPPFVRYVWGLHRDDALCHDPYVHTQPAETPNQTPGSAAAATWFRVERQTTLGVPEENAAFFFIRVYQVPLREAVTTPERAAVMAAALADMTPALAEYKGVTHRRGPLIRWLEARERSHD